MNLIIIAVFAACACFVNGQNSTFANDDVKIVDKLRYWPQIVIIKPMGSFLPSANLYGHPYVKTIRPSPFTTITATTQLFDTYPPETATQFPNFSLKGKEKEISKSTELPNPLPSETDSNVSTEGEVNSTTASTEDEISSTTVSTEPEDNCTETGTGSTESSCQTPSGASGECISVYNCQVLLDLVNKKDRSSQDVDLLKKSQCGYMGSSPAVCCPKQQTQQNQNGNCNTPEGTVGQCVSLYSCAHLANMLKPPVPSENIAYVQKSRCEGPEQYSVCCGAPPNRQPASGPVGNCDSLMTAYPPDPRTECCGSDSRVGNKIVGGNATTVDQYPWLVVIEYVKQGVTKVLCGGVLISGKYVLTASHCVTGQVLDSGTPRSIRLGEYDLSHEGPDCAAVEAGGEDCTDGAIKIRIEKTIPHPQYDPSTKRNDIALIRMEKAAPFTDFIRPICLPAKDLTQPQNVPVNFSLYAAGWGAVSVRQPFSNVKLHVELPYVTQDRCQSAYRRSVALWEGQLCAGGVAGKDSCRGDSGGPLMYENARNYEVIGIVSFGPTPCGMEGIPGVYSKVYEYLDWIRNNIVA